MPAAEAIASMLAEPMPCCSNTSAAASNSFSLVSSRVGRVRTLDMAGILAHCNSIQYRIELHRSSGQGPTPAADPRRQLLPGRHVARLPRRSLSLTTSASAASPAAAGRRHDLVRDGPCRCQRRSCAIRKLSTDESRSTAEKAKSTPKARSQSLLFMDPPDHTRLRGLVARAFTPRRIEELRHATETIATELVYGHEGARPRGRPDRGLRLPAAGAGDLRPARRAGGRRGDVHRLVARDRSRARSLRPALARSSTPRSTSPVRSCAPISATCWRRVASCRATTCSRRWRRSMSTATASAPARCWRSPCCCWSRATRPR